MKPTHAGHARRFVIAALAAVAMLVAAVVTVRYFEPAAYAQQDDAAAYAQILVTLQKELAMRFTDPDDPGLYERRQRLKKLFASVPPAYAKTLYDRLGTKANDDELSKTFHYRLSTPTINELLGILEQIPPPAVGTTGTAPAPPPPPTPPLVWGTRPLPGSESGRFDAALRKLEEVANQSNDDRKWRYTCWFNKLKQANVDDRVVEWGRICPIKTGALGAAYIVGPCDLSWGTPVSQDDLYKNIRSIPDVEAKGDDVGIFTHLKSDFVVSVEMTSLPLENLRTTHDMVIMAIDKLDKWANNEMGGSSAMAKEYVSIKDWIGQQQRNPNSVYSCH